MKRREFIVGLGGAVAMPLAARAQTPSKLPAIGYLMPNAPSAQIEWDFCLCAADARTRLDRWAHRCHRVSLCGWSGGAPG